MLVKLLIVLTISASDPIDRSKINLILNNIESINLKYQGKDGVWFTKDSAEGILNILSDTLPKLLDISDLQLDKINSQEKVILLLKESNASYSELADHNRKMFDIAMKYVPDLKPPEYPWYETPKATFVVGVMVGAVTIFGATYAASRILVK